MYFKANAGHVGCSLSGAEILTLIQFHWSTNKDDEIVLSKGHAAAVLYSVLAEAGIISEETINTFYKDGTYLAAHPPANKISKIPFATGSLGHGLSLACGLALSDSFTDVKRTIYCVTSDGELNEGSIWEAAMFAAHHKLTNLIWLIDRNKLQGFGKTEDVMQLEPLKEKLESFGWTAAEADGHSFTELNAAMTLLNKNSAQTNKPKVLICHTTKGKGMDELENQVGCHYLPMDEKKFHSILEKVNQSE